MTAPPAQAYHSPAYPLSDRFEVEFRFDGRRLDVIWGPTMPNAATAKALLPQYMAARNRWLGHLARETGLNIAVVDAGAMA